MTSMEWASLVCGAMAVIWDNGWAITDFSADEDSVQLLCIKDGVPAAVNLARMTGLTQDPIYPVPSCEAGADLSSGHAVLEGLGDEPMRWSLIEPKFTPIELAFTAVRQQMKDVWYSAVAAMCERSLAAERLENVVLDEQGMVLTSPFEVAIIPRLSAPGLLSWVDRVVSGSGDIPVSWHGPEIPYIPGGVQVRSQPDLVPSEVLQRAAAVCIEGVTPAAYQIISWGSALAGTRISAEYQVLLWNATAGLVRYDVVRTVKVWRRLAESEAQWKPFVHANIGYALATAGQWEAASQEYASMLGVGSWPASLRREIARTVAGLSTGHGELLRFDAEIDEKSGEPALRVVRTRG
jgi:hypothetical protein